MVQLLTTGEALDLFKSRVTLKQMEKNKVPPKVFQLLQEAESQGSDLVLVIPDANLNKKATALLGHWVPSTLDEPLIKLTGLIQTTMGWEKPAEQPTTEQMMETIMEPLKKITDEYDDWKAKHPEEFAQFQQDREQADLDQIKKQEPEN